MAEYRMTEYQGGYKTLDPNKAYSNSFTGYRATAGSLAITTDPRSANVVKEASAKLSSGVKNVELALVSPELFDSIPKQQLEEVRELSKLTGIDVSVHGPVMDSAGFTQQGYSDVNRESAERRIADVVERSQVVNPDGNVPVVFHSAEGIPGSEWKTLGDSKKGEQREAKRLIAVNRKSGQMIPLEKQDFYVPGGEKIENDPRTPEEGLEIANASDWDNRISELFFNKERADEIIAQNYPLAEPVIKGLESGELKQKYLDPVQQKAYSRIIDANSYLREINKKARNIFSDAYEYGNEEQRKVLEEINKEYRRNLEGREGDIQATSQAVRLLLHHLENPALAPEIYVPIEEFATEKSAETFGNAAFKAYKKHGDKTPIITIENPPAGAGLSTGEDLRNLVEASRKKMADNLVKETGMNKKQAEKKAEKFIGATWDVGHINMLRKQGFEDKDIIKETEKIAPYLKHVHLSDNFGFEHTELPMGMGNVPMKEIMEKLGQKGFEATKVVEAATWWQHFQTNPMKEAFEGLGSPMYASASPATVGGMPYWNQSIGFYQSPAEGFGRMLTGINYQTFGAGFSQLPSHLGGDIQGGAGGRMSGRPME